MSVLLKVRRASMWGVWVSALGLFPKTDSGKGDRFSHSSSAHHYSLLLLRFECFKSLLCSYLDNFIDFGASDREAHIHIFQVRSVKGLKATCTFDS